MRSLSGETRFYLGTTIMAITIYAGAIPCAVHQRNMEGAMAWTFVAMLELVATFAWAWRAKA